MVDATLSDLLGEARALPVFVAVLLSPGFIVGWVTDVVGFRGRRGVDRLAWSVALSFGCAAIGAALGGSLLSVEAVCWTFAGATLAAAALLLWDRRTTADAPKRGGWGLGWGAAGFGVWAVFVALELTDLGVGRRLYMSVTVYDHALRSAFVDAVMRTGVPPLNPLMVGSDGHAAPMRYYYFWYVLCAVVAKIAGVNARQALIASCIWGGVGLWSALELCCRHVLVGTRRTSTALLLLAVTGLDLLAVAGNWMAGGATDPDMEWWGVDQVSSWMDSLLWVPHHIAALVCCIAAWVLLWMGAGEPGRKRWMAAVIGGVCLASAFGLSTYVAAAFGMVVLLWVVADRSGRERLPLWLAAYGVSLVLLLPYLRELRASGGGSGADRVLTLGVRRLIDPAALDGVVGLRDLRVRHPVLEENLAATLLLVPGYLCELGFYGAVLLWGVWTLRRGRGLTEMGRTLVILSVAGLVITTFVRSRVIATNDFGIRSALVPQFFLVLLGVEWWERSRSGWLRRAMLTVAAVGVAGTVYQVIGLRVYLREEETLGRNGFVELAERNAAMWQMEQMILRSAPSDATVQYNTTRMSNWAVYALLRHVNRQIAKVDPGCEAVFGGDPEGCDAMQKAVDRIYASGTAALDATAARGECARMGVTVLLATRWDPVWEDRATWVWRLPVIAQTEEVRVLRCENAPG